MVQCAVNGCKNVSCRGAIKLHSLPKDPGLRREWISACRRVDQVGPNARVCSVHFSGAQYLRSLKYELLDYEPLTARLLRQDAVPDTSLPGSSRLTLGRPDSPEEIDPRAEKRRRKRINEDIEWMEDRSKVAKIKEEDSLSLDLFPAAFFRTPPREEGESLLERYEKSSEVKEDVWEAPRLQDLSALGDSFDVKKEMEEDGEDGGQVLSLREFEVKREEWDDCVEIKVEEEDLETEFEVKLEESPVQSPRSEETREEDNTLKSEMKTEEWDEDIKIEVKEEELSDGLEVEVIERPACSPVKLPRPHRKATKRKKEERNKASERGTAVSGQRRIRTIVPMDVDDSDADFEATDSEDDLEDPDLYRSSSDDEEQDGEEGSREGAKCLGASRLQGGLRLEDDPESEDATTPLTPRDWKRADIESRPLPEYDFVRPSRVLASHEYFLSMMTTELMDHIARHTNLYARQCDADTDFATDRNEVLNFVGILMHAGVFARSSREARLRAEASSVMTPGRFRLLLGLIHFNDNELCHRSYDRFYKVRPVYDFVARSFRNIANTPKQCVDEVSVPYGGAGRRRRGGRTRRSATRGFKLFCRASEDGIVHDLVLYQSQATFEVHPVALTPRERAMAFGSKVVVALAKTMHDPSISGIYAGERFASLELVEYLQENFGCRFTGSAGEGRLGATSLLDGRFLAGCPRGSFDYRASGGTLALRWSDERVVTLVSNELGVRPSSSFRRECRETGAERDVRCPGAVGAYLERRGVVARSAKMVRLYETPTLASRWYLRLFAHAIDLCVVNAWLLYRRDCASLGVSHRTLREFRLEVSAFATSDGDVLDAALGTAPDATIS